MALLLLVQAPALVFVGRGSISPMRRLPALRMDVADLAEAVAEVAPSVDAPAAAVVPEVAVAPAMEAAVAPAMEAAVAPAMEISTQVPDVVAESGSLAAMVADFTEVASHWVNIDYLPLILVFTVLPILSFLGYILIDGVTGLFRMASGAKTEIIATSGPLAPEEDLYASVWKDDASVDKALSAWPAILQVKRELETMPAEEARRIKLEVGTNWPPRTTTAKATGFWNDDREGFMFFQGPTPKTAVQAGLPSFFSQDNFADVQVPTTLLVSGGVFTVSFLAVLGVALLG